MGFFDFDHDGDFDLEDLVEADVQYGLFEEDNKEVIQPPKKNIKRNTRTKILASTYTTLNVQDKKPDVWAKILAVLFIICLVFGFKYILALVIVLLFFFFVSIFCR